MPDNRTQMRNASRGRNGDRLILERHSGEYVARLLDIVSYSTQSYTSPAASRKCPNGTVWYINDKRHMIALKVPQV